MMDLLHKIERYMRTTGMAATRLGREAAGDPRLVHDMRRGREVGARLTARILAWLEQAA